jgi:glycosyltransferase involved in cell wall biosynthesis
LKETIISAQQQEYSNIEILVIDNASVDNTEELVRGLMISDPRIFYYKQSENKRAAKARNIGVQLSKGNYVQFLDSDDLLYPDKIKKQVDLINIDSGLDFVLCQSELFGDQTGVWNKIPQNGEQDLILKHLKGLISWGVESPLWKKSFLINMGGFYENLSASEEYEYHVRALTFFPNIKIIEESLVKVRIHQDEPSVRRSFSNKHQRISSFYADVYIWENLKSKNLIDCEIQKSLKERFKNIYFHSVYEENFILTRKVLFFTFFNTSSLRSKFSIFFLGIPAFFITYFTNRNKNFLISILNKC